MHFLRGRNVQFTQRCRQRFFGEISIKRLAIFRKRTLKILLKSLQLDSLYFRSTLITPLRQNRSSFDVVAGSMCGKMSSSTVG